jgi:hypothetical protein
VTANGKKRGVQGYTVGTKQAPAKRRAKPARRRQDHELFSDKIRKNGRWVFLALAIVFGASFILFGVGNFGGIGLNDILQNGGGGGGGSTKAAPSSDALKTALKTAAAKPTDPQAFAALGAAYTSVATATSDSAAARDAYQKATIAYAKAASLKPSDAALQTQLAQSYTAQAAAVEAQIQELIAEAQNVSSADSGASQFVPPTQSTDAFQSAIDSQASDATSAIYAKITPLSPIASDARTSALTAWQKVTALTPRDPNAWFQMASAAAAAGDTKNELAGYKQFLVLVPNDPLAKPVQTQVDSLEGKTTPAPAATGASSGSTATTPGSSTTG